MTYDNLGDLATGAVSAAAVAAVTLPAAALVGRLRRRHAAEASPPLPVAGLLLTVGGIVAIHHTRPVPPLALVGIAGAGLAAGLVGRPRIPSWVPYVVALPFAALVGLRGGLVDVGWVRALVVVAIVFGSPCAARLDTFALPSWSVMAMLATSVAGMYLTVPDTEEAFALVGSVLVAAVLTWPMAVTRLGRTGAGTSLALLMWVAAIDARGRLPSLIGATVALGLLVALPVAERLSRATRAEREARPRSAHATVALALAIHVTVVGVGSRLVGFSVRTGRAALAGSCLLLLAVLASLPLAAAIGPLLRLDDAVSGGHRPGRDCG